jgi:hypothetical protein
MDIIKKARERLASKIAGIKIILSHNQVLECLKNLQWSSSGPPATNQHLTWNQAVEKSFVIDRKRHANMCFTSRTQDEIQLVFASEENKTRKVNNKIISERWHEVKFMVGTPSKQVYEFKQPDFELCFNWTSFKRKDVLRTLPTVDYLAKFPS